MVVNNAYVQYLYVLHICEDASIFSFRTIHVRFILPRYDVTLY